MEEIIWLTFGIVSVLVVLGVVVNVVSINTQDSIVRQSLLELDRLQSICNSVCDLPYGSSRSGSLTLHGGENLVTNNGSFCLKSSYLEHCRVCNCDFESKEVLNLSDLSNDLAITLVYRCSFTKNNLINLSCFG